MASLNDAIERIARIIVGSKQQPRVLYTPAPPRVEAPPPITPVRVFHTGGPFTPTPEQPLGMFSDKLLEGGPKVGWDRGAGHYLTTSRGGAASYGPLKGGNPWIAAAKGDREKAFRLFSEMADQKGLGQRARDAAYDRIMDPQQPRTYEAELKQDPARLMNYDAAVRGQPDAVRRALERIGAVRSPSDLERTAGDVYYGASKELGPLEAAKRLGGEGVPHITYKDPGFTALAPGQETAPHYVIPPGWVQHVLDMRKVYGLGGGAAVMGAIAAAPDEAQAMPPAQPMGALASPLRVASPPPDISGALPPPEPRGRVPMSMTGMTNRNTLMNPDDPIAQVAGNAAQRYTDYVNTAGNLLWGTDPRFIVKPQVPGEWSEYDEENALRTAHELTRRAESPPWTP